MHENCTFTAEKEFPSHCGDEDDNYKLEIVWRNVFIFIYLHCCAVYGFTLQKKLQSIILAWVCGFACAFGTTLGMKT